MRLNEKELIARYFNSQITATEEEVRILQQRVRFRRIDVNDSYELQNALVRYETMKQVCKDISVFLQIDNNIIK
ncbi:MAG: hypothetical protein HDT21_03625 [Ruminococcus sp.]|nr:hypothetical protein [Ruminococcus sp.]